MMLMDENNDIQDYYEFVPDPRKNKEKEPAAVKIILGTFKGLVLRYKNFKFKKPEKEDKTPRMEYVFDILHVPEELIGVNYPDEEKEKFDKLLSKILLDIVMKQIEKSERVKYDNTDREGDIDESFERRVVYEFDNPVSEE